MLPHPDELVTLSHFQLKIFLDVIDLPFPQNVKLIDLCYPVFPDVYRPVKKIDKALRPLKHQLNL